MNLKRRRERWALYRSRWVPKSAEVPHGYSMQEYVGSLPVDASHIPQPLREKLTAMEADDLERRVCIPARAARAARDAAAASREQDAGWRLDAAAKLLSEAAALSQLRRVRAERVLAIQRSLASMRVESADPGRGTADRASPLREVLLAIANTARAVREGAIGSAPATGARHTETYTLWSKIVDAVEGPSSETLLSALQQRGFVTRRRP